MTVSLPRDVYDGGELERVGRGMTRSEFVTGLYRHHLDEVGRQARIARYAAAYAHHPESADDQWLTERSTALLFADGDASSSSTTTER